MPVLTNAIAERISLISESSTLRVAADAARLRSEGVDVVDFSAGEPDFPTPENVKTAAIRAIDENFTKYTAAGGILDLKKAICQRHADDFGSEHPGGVNFLFADGSVHFLNASPNSTTGGLSPAVLAALVTRAGGEPVPPGGY